MKNSFLRHLGQLLHNRFKKNEIALHQLNYLFWECTHRCNLHCEHCGSDCMAHSKTPDMPFEDFLQAIKPLRKHYDPESITVVITGGEPLMRTDLVQCGLRLRQHGFRWGIVTNGLAYTVEMHARLLAAGMGAITLSLDGLADDHNWLRGNLHSFEKACAALDLIVEEPRLSYDVVTCVNARNITKLPQLLDFLISKNVTAWRLFTIAPIGRAATADDMQLSPQQLQYLMDFIVSHRHLKQIKINFSCEAYLGKYETQARDSYFFCRAGVNIASVLIDGSISACPNINRSFTQGNIYNDDLLSVWQNKFELMRNRSWTKTGRCANCTSYSHCNGGAMHLWPSKKDDIIHCIHQSLQKCAVQ